MAQTSILESRKAQNVIMKPIEMHIRNLEERIEAVTQAKDLVLVSGIRTI